MTNTRIPVDFNEWYFISATYNPNIEEIVSHEEYYETFANNRDFWKNNVNINGDFVAQSNLGSKCKVEFISRSDLLRARGYKV